MLSPRAAKCDGCTSGPGTRQTIPPAHTPSNGLTWRQRQRRLGFETGSGWELAPHEVRFYERFFEAGNKVRLIRRSFDGKPTNDFRWVNHEGIEIEVKRPKAAKYSSIAHLIRRAVKKARENHQFIKDQFLIDLNDRDLSEKLCNQLGRYNRQNPENTVLRLWVFARSGLVEIDLGEGSGPPALSGPLRSPSERNDSRARSHT